MNQQTKIMKQILYILFFLMPAMAFTQVVSIEAADEEGNVSLVELNLNDFKVLGQIPDQVTALRKQVAKQDSIINVLIEKVNGYHGEVTVNPQSEYEKMLQFLRDNSLSRFNSEYTEKEIVAIVADIPEIPNWMKSTAGRKADKVDYLRGLL